MKKITIGLLLLIIAISMSSCNESNISKAIIGEDNYTIIMIDGCEYLQRYEGYRSGYSFSHKGNCKNPIHYQITHDTIYIKK